MVSMRMLLRGLAMLVAAGSLGMQPTWADSGSSAGGPQINLGTAAKAAQARGEGCVNDTDVMRSDHMKFLLHQRDETVLHGIRTKQYSLKECIACHATVDEAGGYLRINGEGQFCQTCHDYASVRIDCFDCHATRPAENVQ